MRSLALLALALALPAGAAPKRPARKPAAKPAAKKPAAKPAAGPDLPSKLPAGTPFCKVNGEAIPLALYIDRLSLTYAPQMREMLIEEALVRQEAKRRKIAATGAELEALVKATYDGTARSYGGEARLAEELKKSRGWSPADYRRVLWDQAAVQVLRRKLAESLVKESAVADADVEKHYAERRETFTQPDTVKISHVMVRRPDEEGEGPDRAARAKAEGLLKQVQGGASFEQVAREHSDDRLTGERGGELPKEIVRGANPYGAAFEAAVFGAQPGLVGEVVATPLGYHVIRVDSRKEGRLLPLAEVRDRIRAALLGERRARAMEELFVQLRTRAEIETGKF